MRKLIAALPSSLGIFWLAGSPIALAVGANQVTTSVGPGPVTAWHYAANSNFDSSGTYTPATDGFNVADVSDLSTVNSLPSGDKGLVWIGQCGGATTTFTSAISPFIGNPKVLGFYLMDEPDPDPAGVYGPYCPQANLKAESDWIHANDPGAKTFIILQNMGSPIAPDFTVGGGYNPANTDIDLYGDDPYPCRSGYYGTNGDCDYSRIGASVNAVIASGVPLADIVPVYQAFGGGGYLTYVLPSAAQETQLLATWAGLIPSPVFDYAYSWGSQNDDTALAQSPELQSVFASHNAASLSSPTPTPAAAFVQAQATSVGSRVASNTLTLNSPVGEGDLLVGWFAQYDSSGQVHVSDNVNGAWTRAGAEKFSSGSGDIALYYVQNSKPSSSAVVVTLSADAATYLQGAAAEYRGVASSGALDLVAMSEGSGSAADSGATPAMAPGELVFAALTTGGSPGTLTPGSSQGLAFAPRAQTSTGSAACEDILVGAAGPQSGRYGLASPTNWYAVVATFHPA